MKRNQYVTRIPIAVLVQEATELYAIAAIDKEPLLACGLKASCMELIPSLVEKLASKQADWTVALESPTKTRKKFTEHYKRAMIVRSRLKQTLRLVNPGSEPLNAIVLRRALSLPRVIQDLNTLVLLTSEIKKQHPGGAIAKELATEAESLITLLSSSQGMLSHEQYLRKQLTIRKHDLAGRLYAIVNHIRQCGKYAFNDNPDRLRMYCSEYRRKGRRRG